MSVIFNPEDSSVPNERLQSLRNWPRKQSDKNSGNPEKHAKRVFCHRSQDAEDAETNGNSDWELWDSSMRGMEISEDVELIVETAISRAVDVFGREGREARRIPPSGLWRQTPGSPDPNLSRVKSLKILEQVRLDTGGATEKRRRPRREVKLMKMVVVIKVYKTKFLNTNLLPSRRARMANSARLPRHLTRLSRLPTSPSYAPSFIKAYNFQFGSLISRSVEYGDDCGDNIQTVPDLQPLQRHQIPRDLRHREERPPHAKAISRKYLVIMKPCSLPMTTIVLPAMRTRLNPPPPKSKDTSGRTNEGFPRSTEGNNGNLGFLKQQIPILSLNSSEILKPLDADAFQS
ncbi:hypothetical protein RUND412_008817 [Rhizina undulata]